MKSIQAYVIQYDSGYEKFFITVSNEITKYHCVPNDIMDARDIAQRNLREDPTMRAVSKPPSHHKEGYTAFGHYVTRELYKGERLLLFQEKIPLECIVSFTSVC